MDGELLEIANVRAGYGSGDVLQGVSLSIAEGEIVAVIGRNGVGKTTLMKTVIGLLPATTGAIRFCGDDVTALAARKRSMNGIGYVPQGRQIFPELTVGENLLTGEQVNSFSKDRRLRYDLIYSYFPILRERRQQLGGNLSGGQQQMLAVARALVGGPRFHAFLGAIMVVHLGMATVLASLPRREGTLGKMKLSPIAKVLQEAMAKA